MIYGVDEQGGKVRANRGGLAWCPTCGERLIPKCGRIVTHHWAHPGEDCDPWREQETEWHRYWKGLVRAECAEITIEKNGQKHRADIVTRKGMVIELQHSTLGVEKIEQRETFYGRMIWLFDVAACRPQPKYHPQYYGGRVPVNEAAIRLCLRPNEKGYHTFRWYHPRKSLAHTTAETYLDVGRNEIFRLMKMGTNTPCGGWGYLKPAQAFVEWLQKACSAG